MTAACSMLPPTKDETVENNTCWYSSCLANLPRSQCNTDWYWAQIAQCIDIYIYIAFSLTCGDTDVHGLFTLE